MDRPRWPTSSAMPIAGDGRHESVDRKSADREWTPTLARARAAEQAIARREAAAREAERVEAEQFTTAPGSARSADQHQPQGSDTARSEPRPRLSLLAALSLVTGVVAALTVLTGTLAGYGVALGVLALVLAFGGFSATGRRHVVGRSEAIAGVVLGVGAVILGVLALAGAVPWLSGDTVGRLREWLDTVLIG